MNPDIIRLGKILRVHGLKGEIRIHAFSEDPEIFTELEFIRLGNGSEHKVILARTQKKQAIVKLAGFDSIEAAEKIVGQEVWGKRTHFPRTDDGSYYWVDLIGCNVVDMQGANLGKVESLDSLSGAHDNLVVRREDGREAQIPFVDAMVIEVDVVGKKIRVDLPEGLLDE